MTLLGSKSMAKKNKKISMSASFFLSFLIPGVALILILVGFVIFGYLHISTGNDIFLTIAGIYVLVLSLAYGVISIIIYFRLKETYVDGLYKTTSIMLRNFSNNIPTRASFPTNTRIDEFDKLNADLDNFNTIVSNATMISNDISKAYIPLNYISLEDKLVTLESFKSELRSLIYCSQNFRNVIIEVFYDLDEDTINEEESKRIISTLTLNFEEYPNILFIPNDNQTGFYVFLPRINSFSHIQERLTAAMKDLSIAKKTFDGLSTINARFSIVCYPYSNIDELFPDLQYAKRQGQLMNLYLPNRLTALSENLILQNSLNLNNMSRILGQLPELKVSSSEREASLNSMRNTFKDLITYLDIDFGGVITLDDVNDSYYSLLYISKDKEEVFKEGAMIDKNFVLAMEETKDPDDSCYFASRKHAGYKLAKFLDKINVSGGFYYLVHNQGNVVAVIYFFNKNKDLFIDSYIREAMFILSYRIGDFFMLSDDASKISEAYREINSVMMTSNYALYRIDRNTYDLTSFSQHFNAFFPKAKVGEKCFKALYGLDGVCQNCPLKTNKKMISETAHDMFETALTLNDSKQKLIRMFVRRLQKGEETTNRFDNDLLINSYYSLKLAIENLYTVNARGYLLVLRIDNHDAILAEAGSEGYLYLVRQFIKEIKGIRQQNANIFYFSPESIAILLPETGQIDIVNFIEKIYDVSKKYYQYNGVNYSFKGTYLPYSFPQQYANAEDFLKYTLRHFNSMDFVINEDKIDFPDSDYVRSASRNEFMLSVIEEQFGNKTFSVALQPMVRANDKSIYGAEILIRLSDNYRNSVFNADELIKVAAKNGKISLISNALINYIGELYQQHGLTIFKVFGFTRLTMNTDFSYFDDPGFFQSIFDLFNNYHLPRDFLGFEITEKEIYSHMDQFKGIARGILNHHIALIVDQYSGEYLSLEQVKSLGFTEIKIGRSLVGDIEVNPKHLAEITSLDKLSQEHDLKITFVGVENSDQYVLLRDMDKRCNCQGYHFYKPLDEYKLIEELRKNK